MEQIAVSFTDWWVPKTWLTPTINIIDLWGNKMVENWTLREVGYGWYIYNFDRYSPEKVYLYQFDGGSALSNDYDRYKFGWNDLDAYSNKYSWGRTAAPYFTSVNDRFNKVDKSFKDMEKLKYDDKESKKSLNEIRKEIKRWAINDKLDILTDILNDVKQSVVDTSATNDWNSSKNFSGINGKLDLMAEYVVKMKEDMDAELWMLDDNVAQRIMESNTNLNEWISKWITIEQLLQQVERLENKLNEVIDWIVQEKLPKDLLNNYDITATRKGWMSDEDIMSALWWSWLNQGLWIWMEEWMNQWMNEWLGEARAAWVNAPVDMQWIAEPVMPSGY